LFQVAVKAAISRDDSRDALGRILALSKDANREVYLRTEQFKIQGKDVTGIIGEPAK
jgi:hypothetical protein